MDIKKEIVKIIRNRLELPRYKVFLFGSRATAEAGERSDYDIGIEAEEEIPVDVLIDIKDDIDNLPVMQKIEVVDFKKVGQDFKEVALRNVEVLYEK